LSFLNSFSQNQLYIPPTISGENINLNLQLGSFSFLTGSQTSTMGANGNLLGPTIVLNKGQFVNMNVTNNLNEATTIHWHGMHVSPENDGGPHTVILPNSTWQPSWEVLDNASTHWYHPHLHHHTNEHVQKGIAGMIIIKDNIESALNLPSTYGVDDFPIIVQTKAFDSNNQIIVESALDVNLMVNGTINPYLNLPAQMIRFRLLNGSSERYYNFGLTNNLPFQMVATEGGILDAPLSLTRIMLAPGERAEVIINLIGMENQTLYLKSFGNELPNAIYGATQPGMGAGQTIPNYTSNPLNGASFDVLRINVTNPTNDAITSIPNTLVQNSPLNANQANTTRNITFQSVNQGPTAIQGPFTFNGASFDMDVINFQIPFNNIEIWTLTNQTPISHPFHIHGVSFYILDINGNPPPAHLSGKKDVVSVPAGNGVVRFITKFEDFASDEHPYMYHCHMLTHEDDGMMGQFLVMPPCSTVISTQPQNQLSIINSNVTFSVITQPINQLFQWQTDLGFGFVNLSNAGQYSGVNTSLLTVSNVSNSNNNQLFRCVIGSGFCSDTTETATLTIDNSGNTENLIDLYYSVIPNPATTQITINSSQNLIGKTYVISNLIGERIEKGIIHSQNQIVDIEKLVKGIYFLEINESNSNIRFVKN